MIFYTNRTKLRGECGIPWGRGHSTVVEHLGWRKPGEGGVWRGAELQWDIVPHSPPSKAAILSWVSDLCNLETSCNSPLRKIFLTTALPYTQCKTASFSIPFSTLYFTHWSNIGLNPISFSTWCCPTSLSTVVLSCMAFCPFSFPNIFGSLFGVQKGPLFILSLLPAKKLALSNPVKINLSLWRLCLQRLDCTPPLRFLEQMPTLVRDVM